jgi:hypothetical protein
MGYTLEVDFDVYKAILARRTDESVTDNDVVRELLELPPKVGGRADDSVDPADATSPEDWVAKAVRFPVGTDFRSTYKGRLYTGRVQGGALVVDGTAYDSPSAAAIAITGNKVNGWRFWECRLPGKSAWQLIESLRR